MSSGLWPIRLDVPVESLQLDVENYRVVDAVDSQQAVLNYLYEAEDVMDLARSILRRGYIDNELPVVVVESGRHVVLEGNRRTSALLGLTSPERVPAYEGALRTALRRAGAAADVPTSIRVMEAPSRQQALELVASLHTSNAKKAWTRDQQAKFYYAQLRAGSSMAALRRDYPLVTGISRFIRMAEMRHLIRGARYTDGALRTYVMSDALTMSAFEYAYTKPAIRAAMGIEFDEDGLLTKRPSSLEELVPLTRVLDGFRVGRLNTRSPYLKADTTEQGQFLKYLSGDAPAPWSEVTTSSTRTATASGGAEARDTESPTGGAMPDAGSAHTAPGAPAAGDERQFEESTPDDGGGSDFEPEASDGPTDPAGDSGAATGLEDAGAAGDGNRRGANNPDTRSRLSTAHLRAGPIPPGLERRLLELQRIDVGRTPCASVMLMRAVLEGVVKHHLEQKGLPSTGKLEDVLKVLRTEYAKDRLLKPMLDQLMHNGDAPFDRQVGTTGWLNGVSHSSDRWVEPAQVQQAWQRVEPIVRRLLLPER